MKRPLRVIAGVLLVYFVFGFIIGFYEYLNGGPWYTYVNFRGERLVLGDGTAAVSSVQGDGQEIPAAFRIIDSVFYPVLYFTRNLYS